MWINLASLESMGAIYDQWQNNHDETIVSPQSTFDRGYNYFWEQTEGFSE